MHCQCKKRLNWQTTQSYKFLGYKTSKGEIEGYPNVNARVGADFSATFKNVTAWDEVTLMFGYGKEVTDNEKLQFNTNNTSSLAKGAFGMKKMQSLRNSGSNNTDEIIAIAKAYGLNSNITSFKVLRSAWDYVSYGVAPSYQFAADYRSILNQNAGKTIVQSASNITGDVLEGKDAVRTITGQLTYETGEGIPGASVLLKGTSNGVATDDDGFFLN